MVHPCRLACTFQTKTEHGTWHWAVVAQQMQDLIKLLRLKIPDLVSCPSILGCEGY